MRATSRFVFVAAAALVLGACAAMTRPAGTGLPRASEPPKFAVLAASNERRNAAIASWKTIVGEPNAAATATPELEPVTATVKSLPSNLQTQPRMPLVRINDKSTKSDEETRESLRRFMASAAPLVGAGLQELSLVGVVDAASGAKTARYRQNSFHTRCATASARSRSRSRPTCASSDFRARPYPLTTASAARSPPSRRRSPQTRPPPRSPTAPSPSQTEAAISRREPLRSRTRSLLARSSSSPSGATRRRLSYTSLGRSRSAAPKRRSSSTLTPRQVTCSRRRWEWQCPREFDSEADGPGALTRDIFSRSSRAVSRTTLRAMSAAWR